MEKEKKIELPFINLSKENMILLKDMFETDEIGNIMIAITDKVYFDTEPTQLTKKELGGYKQLMSVIERKANGYFAKVNQGIENFKKVNEKRKNEKEELSCYTEKSEAEIIMDKEKSAITEAAKCYKERNGTGGDRIFREILKRNNINNGSETANTIMKHIMTIV